MNYLSFSKVVKFNCFIQIIFLFSYQAAYSQHFLGLGIHVNPPIRIDNCCNSFIKATPLPSPAASISYKRIIKNAKKRNWYYEGGIGWTGLLFNYQRYFNDFNSLVWDNFTTGHFGFISFSVGGGVILKLPNIEKNSFLSIGIEASARRSHDLGRINISNDFGLQYSNDDVTFPLFLRPNIGFSKRFIFFKYIPAHFQLYTKLSWQDIAVSPQFIRDPSSGQVDDSGKYRLNYSELGLKLYIDIKKEHYNFIWEGKEKKSKKRKQKNLSNHRISVESQLYSPPATKYFIPQVDSFSVTGHRFAFTNQWGIKVEFVHPRKENWATLIGIGVGEISDNYQFKAVAAYTMDEQAIKTGFHSGSFNTYIIPSLGLANRRQISKKTHLQHNISTTLVIPLEKEDSGFFQFERSFFGTPPHLIPTFILKGEVNHKYGRDPVLVGIEYQPELLFNVDKRIFYGIGLVFNYSYGITGQGRVSVDNGRTPYYGGFTQGFSKIGLSARIGWRSNKY